MSIFCRNHYSKEEGKAATSAVFRESYMGVVTEMSFPDRKISLQIQSEVNRVIKGLPGIVRLVTIAIFAQGHLLLKGLPGVAKTTLLRAFSKTIGGGFSRISGTPDLMPTEFLFTLLFLVA